MCDSELNDSVEKILNSKIVLNLYYFRFFFKFNLFNIQDLIQKKHNKSKLKSKIKKSSIKT